MISDKILFIKKHIPAENFKLNNIAEHWKYVGPIFSTEKNYFYETRFFTIIS